MTIQALTASQISSFPSTIPSPYDPHTTCGKIATQTTNGVISGILQTVNIHDHTYQGKMVTAQHTVSDTDPGICKIPVGEFKDMIKKELLHKLLDEIVKSNLIEFTSQSDVVSGQTHYRARIFATPDSQVRLIRKSMKD